MHLLRQEFTNIQSTALEPSPVMELLQHDVGIADAPSMDILHDFISDTPNPTVIRRSETGEIVLANTAAIMVTDEPELIGRVFDVIFPVIGTDPEGVPMVQINEYCSNVSNTEFKWDGQSFVRSELIKKADSPTNQNLETWKKMIAVMLHRFRSPLTGVSGYLDILKEYNSGDQVKNHVDKVSKGIDQVFSIMDELESLHHSPLGNSESTATSASLPSLVDLALLDLPKEARTHFRLIESDIQRPFRCTNSSLKIILKELMENAWEHNLNDDAVITIERINEQVIRIHNSGTTIPQEIARNLFYPFITTKAANLGIGLSIALMHARHHDGTIFLSENSTDTGIAFDICMKN